MSRFNEDLNITCCQIFEVTPQKLAKPYNAGIGKLAELKYKKMYRLFREKRITLI